MNIKKHIPNAITCGNLFFGCIAILAAEHRNIVLVAVAIGIAAILDFFDGMAARMLKVSSPIGKDLDSLADMVSFGVVPGVLMHKMMQQCFIGDPSVNGYLLPLITYFPFIITLFSAIRLAKFNNDTRQSDSFIGLPTPANTLLITSLALIMFRQDAMAPLIHNAAVIFILSILCSYLLVAELPLLALKFKNFGWKGNELRYMLVVVALLLLISLSYRAIPLIILVYVLLSLVNTRSQTKQSTK